ncbi:hypothetical protein JCM19235_1977 [Vibrio maritimus]|uniref:Uncharacterized protein n=1 Tax=Vibrio maritimus TaxID=990268 RepID=A0A090RWI1_9VIBR|nr:hypothetical protein JCM19235_1977 [Vibrio maritimus]
MAGWHLHYDPEVGEDRIHGVKITTSELITPGFLTLVRQKAVNDPGLFGAKNLAKPLVMYFDSLGKEISK